MSGHSHWSGIKRKKEITDKKRGKVFSKLSKAITAAVGTEPNPDFNPRLRTAVQRFQAYTGPLKPHFAYGALSRSDFALAHALHIANHQDEITVV